MLKRFWDLESIGITTTGQLHLTPEDKLAWDKVNNSLKFDGQHYEVAVPWRDERPQLPNNLPMAKKRLVSTERKLIKDTEIAVAYQQVLNDYLNKKDICQIPDEEPTPECQWLLPHFPVVRPEKATSKVWIVFDGSAPFEGKSLNAEALTRLKLQSDIFDILVKFRKEWVALIVDISQMYHSWKTDRCIVFSGETYRSTKKPKFMSFFASCLAAATACSAPNLLGRSTQKSTKILTLW